MKHRLIHLLLSIATALAFTGTTGQSLALAQGAIRWTPQQTIPNMWLESEPPFMVADQNHTVHAFNQQPASEKSKELAIFYRTWTLKDGWSKPIDILLSPVAGDPRVEGAYLDKQGTIHLLFFAGSEAGGSMYYTQAPAALAGRISAWSIPEIIGEDAGPFPAAALAGDDKGNLFVVYAGKGEGIGLYETHSTDRGTSWSKPYAFHFIYEELEWPAAINMDIAPDSRLDVVWSEWNRVGTSDRVMYAHLDPDHEHWSEPFQLAQRDPGEYEADWGSVINYQGEIIVVYQDSGPATKWMRRSTDGGTTWTPPTHPWPHVGEYSNVAFMVDSNNQLHVILGDRNGDCCHGMWHGVWLNGQWGPLEALVMGVKTPQFDPSKPHALISQGNVILATWWTDTGGGPRNGVWYSFGILNAPELPMEALPIPSPTPTAVVVEPTATPLPTATPNLSLASPGGPRQRSLPGPGMSLVFVVIPVGLFLVGIVTLKQRRRH